jgi:type 2A phosphatase activator TIP41
MQDHFQHCCIFRKSFDKVIDYDWTYQSSYCGTITSGNDAAFEKTSESIDYNRLKPSNPKASQILFYDENCLYEDEMGDNGTSSFTIRLRVMPIGIFVLVRNFVRVDKVVFKSIEHRYWIEFAEASMGKVLKEKRIRQQSYGAVLNRLGPQDIKNEALVVEQLPVTECTTFKLTTR